MCVTVINLHVGGTCRILREFENGLLGILLGTERDEVT
jgi:hypothetical protein